MMDTLLVLIPALPFAAFLLLAFFGRAFAAHSHWPVVSAFAGSCVLSLLLLLQVQSQSSESINGGQAHIGYEHTYTLWTWADVKDAYLQRGDLGRYSVGTTVPVVARNFTIDITLRADPLTVFMLCMVTFISTLVAIYAIGYMHGDPGYPRFFTYIALFVFSMTMLVSVSNFLLLYVFWEAVGLCSYLLVGFWYEKPAAAAAGKKAFLVNRVGDFGFAIALFLIWTTYGTLNYHDTTNADGSLKVAGVLGQTRLASASEPFSSGRGQGEGADAGGTSNTLTPALSQKAREPAFATGGVAVAICLLLMAGACGKSAQFPLHVWLPDAMEGPTPVARSFTPPPWSPLAFTWWCAARRCLWPREMRRGLRSAARPSPRRWWLRSSADSRRLWPASSPSRRPI